MYVDLTDVKVNILNIHIHGVHITGLNLVNSNRSLALISNHSH